MKQELSHPPKLAKRILQSFLREDLCEEVLGDLEEKFQKTIKGKSRFRTRLDYWFQVINYLRPFAFRKSKSSPANQYAMIQNYLKTGWRNMANQKMYSSIKTGGFAIGIAACFLIALLIRDELKYDRHVPDGDRIYRVLGVYNDEGNIDRGVHFPAPFASALKADYPEIEMVARYNAGELFGAGSNEIRRLDKLENSYEDGFTYADQSLLDMFQIPMVYGSREHALAEPNSIVITRRKAEKYFPNEEPIGKQFIINEDKNKIYTVGGVIENFPSTSHLQFDFLITMSGLEFYKGEQTNWRASNYPTYVVMSPGTDIKSFESKVTKGTIEKYWLPSMIEAGEVNAEEEIKKAHLELQPLRDIHLYSEDIGDGLMNGDIRFVWLFGSIAGFILLLACINFINLSTAKSANRAKEVGLRKVVGSFRTHLIGQFLTESMLFCIFSFAIGIGLAWMLLPYFNVLSGKSLVFPWEWQLIPILLGSIVLIGTIAGLYPSLYLSSFRPIDVLKGKLALGSKSSGTRSMLVVFQFTTSIVLIVGTFVIYRQMQFILTKKVGFEKDQVLLIQGTGTLGEQVKTFKDELKAVPQVKSVSISDYLPIRGTKRNGNTFWKEGKVKTEKGVSGQYWKVDADYIKTMGIQVVQGRDFSEELITDGKAAIINQSMVKELELKDPIGKTITNGYGIWPVVGVVEDFNFNSLKENIEPLVLMLGNSPNIISVKLSTNDMAGSVESVTSVWKKFSPNQPIRYSFLDDSFARMYDDVQRTGKIFTTFAVLAIIVACLGLFALSAFMVEQRGKEISIRIVLGAPSQTIFRLLTQNFMKLVFIAILIAVPIAWYLMKEWLKEFAYRIDLGWDVFVLAGIMAIGIALFTISYQSIKAAFMNPINNLKSE